MRLRILGLGAVLMVAGCTSQEDPAPARPTQVDYPKVEAPIDRDERAVVSALRRMDACALLDPIGPSKPVARGPHQCGVPGDDIIRVTLGVPFDRQHKYRAVPLDLGGAKAYVDTSEPGDDSCRVAIPVSFALTIAVTGRKGHRSGTGDICARTQSAATVAATRLANPPAGSATSWTACELLAEVAGDSVLEHDKFLGVDACRARERSSDQLGKLLFRINLEHRDDPTKDAKEVRTVAGQRVAVLSDSSGCSFVWNMVTFHALDCAKGEPLLPKLITAAASGNPDSTSPQRPLLIRLDEPDQPLVGACVDYLYNVSCQPSTEMPVPQGAKAALTAAAGDARVECAIAGEAVRSGFGTTLTPVLVSWSERLERPDCHFVEPGHTTDVEVFVRPDDDINGAILTGEGRDVTVAGRPAKSGSTGNDHRLCVLPVSGAKTGLLCVVAHFLPGRGKESDAPSDTSKASQLEPVVTDIVSRYFS